MVNILYFGFFCFRYNSIKIYSFNLGKESCIFLKKLGCMYIYKIV